MTKKKSKDKKVRIKTDPAAEYRALMARGDMARVISLSNDEALPNIRGRFSTRSLALDQILRGRNLDGTYTTGGIPMGRITELYGPPHSGKSSMLDSFFATAQAMGGEAVLIDTEVSRDRYYMQQIGVDLTKLHYVEMQRATIEAVMLKVAETIAFWKPHDVPVLIGYDSLGKTATEDELDKYEEAMKKGEIAPKQPGSAARAMAGATRVNLSALLGGSKIALVIVNHEYEAINSFGWGKKKETYGGVALQYSSSLRLEIRYKENGTIKNGAGWPLGREMTVRLAKNRLGLGGEAAVPFIQGRGISNVYTVLSALKQAGVIVTSGAWSAMNVNGRDFKFQGFEQFEQICAEPEVWSWLVALYNERAQ